MARRWLLPFRRWRGRILTEGTVVAESFAREKMMNSDGFAQFENLNKGYDLGSVNTRGRKKDRPRFLATRGQIICYRPRSFVTRGQIICYRFRLVLNRSIKPVICFGCVVTRGKMLKKISKMPPPPNRLRFRNNRGL